MALPSAGIKINSDNNNNTNNKKKKKGEEEGKQRQFDSHQEKEEHVRQAKARHNF